MNTTTVLGNLGLHVHLNPAGTYSFVGTIPAALGAIVKATPVDCIGGRAFMANGEAWTLSFPVFATREAAVTFAEARGFEVAPVHTGGAL